jgi:hypothetical protein
MKWIGGKGLLLFVVAAGCAGVDVYTDEELEHKTGLPFYMAKPYLLVKRTGATAAPVSVEVIYLPDLERPYYARQRVGVGKAKLTVKMTDGKLTEFVADADSKASEFTGALTAELKSIAEALKIQRETEILRAQARVQQAREHLAAQLEELADEIVPTDVPDSKRADARRLRDGLRREAARLRDPSRRGDEEQVADGLEAKLSEWDGPLTPATIRELRRSIRELRAASRMAAAAEPTFELYEFRMQDGQTTLVPVALPTGGARTPTSAG